MADLSGRDVTWLERRRAELFGLMAQAGDFRRGALNVVWRRCGKPNCACAQPGHRGHGPQYNLTRRIGGKTVNEHLRPGPELEKAQREVAEHQRFVGLVEEVTMVSEAICAARLVTGSTARPPAEGERGGARQRARGDRRRRDSAPGRARWQLDLTLPTTPWLTSRHTPGPCVHALIPATRTKIYAAQPRPMDHCGQAS